MDDKLILHFCMRMCLWSGIRNLVRCHCHCYFLKAVWKPGKIQKLMWSGYKFKMQIISLLWSNSSDSKNIPILYSLFWWRPVGQDFELLGKLPSGVKWENCEKWIILLLFWYMFATVLWGIFKPMPRLSFVCSVSLSVVSSLFFHYHTLDWPNLDSVLETIQTVFLSNFCLNFFIVCNCLGNCSCI